MDGKFIAYYRVSTDHQGLNGNGMAAQRKAVEDYLNGGQWKLVGEFTEVESGKRSDRVSSYSPCADHERGRPPICLLAATDEAVPYRDQGRAEKTPFCDTHHIFCVRHVIHGRPGIRVAEKDYNEKDIFYS